MIPKVKLWNYTASSVDGLKQYKGTVSAPTKYLAKLNVQFEESIYLIDIKIGGSLRNLTEDQKNTYFTIMQA